MIWTLLTLMRLLSVAVVLAASTTAPPPPPEDRDPATLSEAEIADMVDAFVRDADGRYVSRWDLLELGERGWPALVAALDDPEARRAHGRVSWSDGAIDDIADVLVETGNPDVVAFLLERSKDPDEGARTWSAFHLASIGSEAVIEPVLRLLADDAYFPPGMAVNGIGSAVRSGRASEPFRIRMFTALAEMATGRAPRTDSQAAAVLLDLDRPRAIEVLRSDAALAITNEGLRGVLNALNEAEIAIPIDPLVTTLDHALDQLAAGDDWPWSSVLGEATLGLAAHPDDPRARTAIERGLESDDDRVRWRSAIALCRLMGLPDPSEIAIGPWDSDWATAPVPVRQLSAVILLDGLVGNGGFIKYVDGGAATWRDARAGAAAMGADALVDRLDRVLALVRADRDISDATADALDALSSEHFDDPERLWPCIARFAVQHRATILSWLEAKDAAPH